jgi:hypothetical protein
VKKVISVHSRFRGRATVVIAAMTLAALAVGPLSSGAVVKASHRSTSAASAHVTKAVKTVSLKGICPNPVVIATDWTPEAEQGAYYQLAASGGTTSTSSKTYTAPLLDPNTGKSTGVQVELLAGGPALGYLQTPEVLTTQTNVLMGADDSDNAIADAGTTPVVGIVAPFNNSVHIILWNPAKFSIKSFADVKSSGATVLYFSGTEFVEYMAGAGYLNSSQLDSSYNGSPARFVASGGGVMEQGFATAEPYLYTHETPSWDQTISYELTSNTGYNPYSEMGEATPTNLKKYASCFKKLVPMIQQSQISYLKSPNRVNKLIVGLNTSYGEIGGNYDMAVAQYADRTMLADRIVSQGSGGFGSFSLPRVNTNITQLRPVLNTNGQSLPANFNANQVVTNKFINSKIKFTSYKGPYNTTTGVITVVGTNG